MSLPAKTEAKEPRTVIEVTAAGAPALAARYREVRSATRALCEPLAIEDYVVQSMPDASPAKWHLAHTTWFFETFLLKPHSPGYVSPNALYETLFNSYYNAVGQPFTRSRRGLLSRPTVDDVLRYRKHVDDRMGELLLYSDPERLSRILPVADLGLHHEQQHQELIVTDLKHMLAQNPIHPVYRERPAEAPSAPAEMTWRSYPGGVVEVGHPGDGFAFDNEMPRHRQVVRPFALASRAVTNGEYLAFVEDGGYDSPRHWLSAGWDAVRSGSWKAPLYWVKDGGRWWTMTLAGYRPVAESEPVCHVSYFEADAYARWVGERLPTEAEWEIAAREAPAEGNFLESTRLHPAPQRGREGSSHPIGMYGDVWEWTQSPYAAYPGYRPSAGALGEYNGKFMCGQFVLRGGSCATPASHIRPTYRNFFAPDARWQFSGLRLARDV